jgi:hypothetical protein
LIAKGGLYARLYQLQNSGTESRKARPYPSPLPDGTVS